MISNTDHTDAKLGRPAQGIDLLDKVPPHSPQAEESTIGSCLLDPRQIEAVRAVIQPDDFYNHQLGVLFEHLCAMDNTGAKIDVTLLAESLKGTGDFERAGGAARIADAYHAVAVAAHAVSYGRTVRRDAQKRRLINAGLDLVRQAHDTEPDDAAGSALAAIEAATAGPSDAEVTPIEQAADKAVEHATAVLEGRHGGMMTGLERLDTDLGGLFAGDLTILAARPGCGKTALAGQLAIHFAQRGRNVLFVSLEMAETELATRMVCSKAGVPSNHVRTGRLHEDDLAAMREAAVGMGGLPLTITDAQGLTTVDVRRLVRQAKRRSGCDVVILDYLGRLQAVDPRQPRYLQVGQMTGDLKTLAVEQGVSCLCLAQLSRAAEGKGNPKPRLEHLRESGSIEQDADVVLSLHRDQNDATTLDVLKNRHGVTGSYSIQFDAPTMTFTADLVSEWAATVGSGDDF